MGYLRFIIVAAGIFLLAACGDDTEETGGFLWEVENGDTTVYLQGTLHLGEEDFYPLQSSTEAAYETSDVVLPEINLNDMDEEEVQSLTMDLATYDDSVTLEDRLPPDLYEEVEGIMQSYGLEEEMYAQFEPWYVEMILQQMITEESDYEPQYGVDLYFLDRAEEDGKEIVELESYEEQMEMMAGFSEDTQIEMLENSVAEHDNAADELDEIVTIWTEGDMEAMNETTEEYPDEYMEAFNDERNADMAEQISDILENDSGQTYFVIVGTMHMTEEPSIVSILENEGYEVNVVE